MKRLPLWHLFLKIFFSVVIALASDTLSAQTPAITSFTPTSGPIGTAVTITGSNFSATPANNVVWFGAVQAAVTAASATELTVTVPAGATCKPVSVTVAGNTAYSNESFIVTFQSTHVIDAGTFATENVWSSGGNPWDLTIGDLDGDGKPDLIIVHSGSNNFTVYRNTSTPGYIIGGSLDGGNVFSTGSYPICADIGDLDGDGKLDLVVANNADGTVSIFRNTSNSGTITFNTRVDFTIGSNPYDVAIGDIDGDGKPDIAITNNGNNTVSVLRNTSTPGSITSGSFAAKVDFTTGANPSQVAISDIDGDGKNDLIVNNLDDNTVSLFRNISSPGSITSGSLASSIDFATGSRPYGVAVSDLDGDGKKDLVVTNNGSATVSVFRNISNPGPITSGSLASKVDFITGDEPYGLSIGDIDGDGRPDLAVACYNGGVSVLRNTSINGSITNNSFASKADFGAAPGPADVVIGDLDRDGKPDLLIVTNYWPYLVVLQNILSEPVVPVITSFTPTSGPVGTEVTVTGTNFSTTASENIVWFGAVRATVTAATTTQLTVTVPVGATYQPISVTVKGYTAWSDTPFDITFPVIRPMNTSAFAAPVDFSTGTYPWNVAVGDIDGDGKPDMVIINNGGASVSVYRNTSNSGSITSGSFSEKVDFTTGGGPYGVTLQDIDGDGKLDLALVNSSNVSIFRNTSTPGSITASSFAGRVDFPAGSSMSVDFSDIDGDGKPDMVFQNGIIGTFSVCRNISTPGSIVEGSFETKVDFATGNNPQDVGIADIDGDGKPDIVTVNNTSNTVSVFRNTSISGSINSGSFAAKVDFTTGSGPRNVIFGDIDDDGKPDMVVVNNDGQSVSVFRNTSTSGSINSGSFAEKVDFTTGTSPNGISIGDVNGDGRPDLIITNYGSNTVSVLKNTSTSGSITTSSFATKVDLTTGSGPIGIAIADVNGDGRPDLAIVNTGSNTVSVIQNIMSDSYPPAITSFTPTSGPIGTEVTITGTNFDATPANNIVWFGAVKAIVTAVTATQLTVTVPTGSTYQPITVTVNGLTAYSSKPFNVTFPSSHVIDASAFAAKMDFASGTAPWFSAIGDIDGDGKPDFVIGNPNSNMVSVYRNTSSSGSVTAGSFATKVDFTTGSSPNDIVIGDIDGDGRLDVVVTNQNSNSISVFRNISTPGSITSGSFANKVDFTTGNSPYYIAIGDIDGDGKPDLAVTNWAGNTVSVFRNTSTSGSINSGSFATKVDFTIGTYPSGVGIGDIDGDGKPDLVVNIVSNNTVSILRNTSTSGSITTGSFAANVDFPIGTGPLDVVIGDLDSDGKPDLAITNSSSNSVSVLRNTSTSGSITAGSFAARVDFTTGTSPWGVAIGDIDGDGKQDLVVAGFSTMAVSIFRNTGSSGSITSGSFATKVDFITGSDPLSVALGDLDGDGKPDLLATNSYNNTISVLRNTISTTVPAPPVITSFTPTSGPIGDTVTITGTNFSITVANNIVWFGAVQATVTAATSTSLSVLVPTGATYQPITVTNVTTGLTAYSNAPFNVTFTSSHVIDVSAFTSKIDFPSGTNPWSVAIGDIDGDGKPDLIVTNSASNTVSVFRNTSTSGSITAGSFASKVDFATGSGPWSVAISDLDGDGKLDLAVADFSSSTVSIFRNTSTSGSITAGSFAARVDFTTVDGPQIVAISDLDGNGKPDLVVTGSSSVSVLRNTSTSGSISASSFDAKVDFTTGSNAVGVAIGDIDSDGKPDIVIANFQSNTVSVLRNTSNLGTITSGSFSPRIDFTTGTNPWYIVLGDLDGDGKPDLAVTNYSSSTVSIFRNTSTSGSVTTGSFAAKVDFTTGSTPYYAAIGDIDGDGKPDLAVANNGSQTVSVFRNTSSTGFLTTGSFATRVDFSTGTGPQGIAIGDIDGDGKPDIIYTNRYDNSISVLRNTISLSAPVSPVITSFTPAFGPIGTTVTINGSNFSTTPENNTVKFGNIQATVISATETQLTVTVPTTGSGGYQLSVTVNSMTGYSSEPFNIIIPQPVISSFTPTSGPIGTTVTINGSNFSTTPENNIVKFGNIQATVISATETQLTVTVPTMGSGGYQLSVTVNSMTGFSNEPFSIIILQPVITFFTPTSGPIGTTVTITGSNFSSTPENNIVRFGDIQAMIISATETQLTVTVPEGSGNYQLFVTVNNMTASSSSSFYIGARDSFEFESSIITLNGDGVNDRLVIKNFEAYGECSFSVFNSRGALIYSNKNYTNDWDMTVNGHLLETGGYFYIAETGLGVFRGSFSILR
jgi:gliding motility-associated-like protein